MKRSIKYAMIAGLLISGLMVGCTDRKQNIPNGPDISDWNIETSARHVFYPYLRYQLNNGNSLVNMGVYVPRAAMPEMYGGQNQRVPVLVLLPPQEGDEYYYYNHGLFRLAEDMIASGEIQPMAIVCLANDRLFGGYFYGNSWPAGMYDSIIGQDMIDYINSTHPMVLNERTKRGIGGMGQGAYGAFRAAIKHPEAYCSVSAVDGPLDFDGADGNHGLKDLFQAALNEQGLTAGNFKDFDSSKSFPISNMFIGGSLAFSPHDTLIRDTNWVQFVRVDQTKTPPDSVYELRNRIRERDVISDSSTLITKLIGPMTGGFLGDTTGLDFHLPFDGNGALNTTIWTLWMQNNLKDMYELRGSRPLANTKLLVATSNESDWGTHLMAKSFHEQTESWITTLKAKGFTEGGNLTVVRYTGYEGKPAYGSEYVYDLLRKMLKFHSDAFGR